MNLSTLFLVPVRLQKADYDSDEDHDTNFADGDLGLAHTRPMRNGVLDEDEEGHELPAFGHHAIMRGSDGDPELLFGGDDGGDFKGTDA